MGDGEGVGGACSGGVLWMRDAEGLGRGGSGSGFSGGGSHAGKFGFGRDWEKLGCAGVGNGMIYPGFSMVLEQIWVHTIHFMSKDQLYRPEAAVRRICSENFVSAKLVYPLRSFCSIIVV